MAKKKISLLPKEVWGGKQDKRENQKPPKLKKKKQKNTHISQKR